VVPTTDTSGSRSPTAAAFPTSLSAPATDQLYTVIAQTPKSTLKVISAQVGKFGTVLTVEYTATDGRKVDISAPNDKDAFFLRQGTTRYLIIAPQGIVVGSTTQAVAVGSALDFTLTFPPLDNPTQAFDLVEGEHTVGSSATSYWDIEGIQLQASS